MYSAVSHAQIQFIGNAGPFCSGDNVTMTLPYFPANDSICYSVTQIPFSPDSVGGSVVIMTDDDIDGGFPIGFNFEFFGNVYDTFYVGSNGWVGFTEGQEATFVPSGIPNVDSIVPKNCIMAPWRDWHPGLCATSCVYYHTTGVQPNRKLVIG
jgi:hypothetical protein